MTRTLLRLGISDALRKQGFAVFGVDPMVVIGTGKVVFLRPRAKSDPVGDDPVLAAIRDRGWTAREVKTVEEAEEVVFSAPYRA